VFIIPYFIQHRGCPHRCLFCNQLAIAGQPTAAARDVAVDLEQTIDLWLGRKRAGTPAQVAFYGGSFTCLDERVQHVLLEAVRPYIRKGEVQSIRLSTRPDCVSDTICSYLETYGVRTIELGVQSMDAAVLARAQRGHSVEAIRDALSVLKRREFEIGVQLMPGLPGETTASFLRGIDELVGFRPHIARLYPTLVIRHTELEDLYAKGQWQPLSLNRAITITRLAGKRFQDAGTKVIRMGLQPTDELAKELVAGPYHPSFGDLVKGRGWYLLSRKILTQAGPGKMVTMTISGRDYSSFVGPRKQNLKRLESLPSCAGLVLRTDTALEREQFRYAVS
jgi:histone acetyltransferase (RNA polymerase elongator complex component)